MIFSASWRKQNLSTFALKQQLPFLLGELIYIKCLRTERTSGHWQKVNSGFIRQRTRLLYFGSRTLVTAPLITTNFSSRSQ